MKPSRKLTVIAGLLVLGLAAGAAWWTRPIWLAASTPSAGGQGARSNPAQAPEAVAAPVETVRAAGERVTDQVEALGTLAPDEQVPIASEISGRIVSFHFTEGEEVEAGAKLVELDPAIAQAELRQARANLSLAEDAYERSQTLVQRGSGTQVALEQAAAQLTVARANVASAEIKLNQLTLLAPFKGMVGLRVLSVGTIVAANQLITTLTALDPIKVDFSIPELFLSAVQVGQRIDVRVDAVPNQVFTGQVYAIDPTIDASGRAVRLRARIFNPEKMLRPGLFARVSLKTAIRENAVVIPETALVAAATGQESAIYIVKDGRATLRPVQTGQRFDGKVEILKGVAIGDEVVVAGQIRLRDGARVAVTQAPARAAKAATGEGTTHP